MKKNAKLNNKLSPKRFHQALIRQMPNISRNKILIIVNVLGLILIAAIALALRVTNQENAVNLPIPPADGTAVATYTSSTPVTLIIPAIGVNAKVEPVGKTAGGNMAVPSTLKTVAWYKLGAAPGEIGNVVMAGHLDSATGKPGVFINLHELKIGDLIEVIGESGEKFVYKVTGSKVVPYENPGPEVLQDTFGKTDKARLNLITCEGTWVQAKKSYTDRFIVNSELVRETRP